MGIYTKVIDLQKMEKAWNHVKKNHPAPGADHVTWDEFDKQCKENLKELQMEILNDRYEVFPVKLIQIFKEEKVREVSLYAMRDKVVQQSLALELNRIYEPLFSKGTYAYRANHSSLNAISDISEQIIKGKYTHYMKLDIHKFFDHVDVDTLFMILRKRIREEEVLSLIKKQLIVKYLDDSGELCEKKKGIYQGSGIAPVLSNVYLMEFDQEMAKESVFFIRYSDDMLILAYSEEDMKHLLQKVNVYLEKLQLKLNERKCSYGRIQDGFDFLGYHFDHRGKSIPVKAKKKLENGLEQMWLTGRQLPLEERLKKASAILNGWEQYYREERKPENILELAVAAYKGTAQKDMHYITRNRKSVHNEYSDLVQYMSSFWMNNEMPRMAVYEWEDYFDLLDLDPGKQIASKPDILREALHIFEKMLARDNAENLTELMQLYSDADMYNTASVIAKRLQDIREKTPVTPVRWSETENTGEKIPQNINHFMNLFVGREDIYKEEKEYRGNRRFEEKLSPLEENEVRLHMSGVKTLATYVQRNNATVHFMVFDIDISKKILLQVEYESEVFREYMKKAGRIAVDICSYLEKRGMKSYIEYSGYRGYHVWLFFDAWISVRYANMLEDIVLENIEIPPDCTVEVIPNKTHLKPGKFGQAIKMPYGIHSKSGKRSRMLENDLGEISDIDNWLKDIAVYSLNTVKKILSHVNNGRNSGEAISSAKTELKVPEQDLQQMESGIRVVLENCSLMRYLYMKAKTTGYLVHGERLSILYVFGHLGEEGKKFVHTVMEFTLNYQYHVTDRFIQRLPEKPISCVKLREQYSKITAEYGCSCAFRRTKNCYPSPVLHAVKLSDGTDIEVTIPTSRNMTKEKAKDIRNEMNIHNNVQNLAQRVLDLKKQKRGVDRSIAKLEKELSDIFDSNGIECLEIEMGMLCRRKNEDGYEWIIEI